MINDLYIFGEGGLGRELFEDISKNDSFLKDFNLKGYVVDENIKNPLYTSTLEIVSNSSSILIAIGDQHTRKMVYSKLLKLGFTKFPNYFSPHAIISSKVNLGIGNLILAHTVLSVDINLGNFNIINIGCTIGHDVEIGNFVTISPQVAISGNCLVKDESFLGTSSTLLPKVVIEENVTVGAGSVVLRKCEKNCTYFGVPAMKIG